MTRTELRLEDLLGRKVRAGNNRSAGRIEEVRAEADASGCRVIAFVIGAGGLLERLHLGTRLVLGLQRHGRVARWDQLDLTDPDRPRLTVPVDSLDRVRR